MTEAEQERAFDRAIARRIEAYWAERGYAVTVATVVAGAFDETKRAMPVRYISNIKNGLPQPYGGRNG